MFLTYITFGKINLSNLIKSKGLSTSVGDEGGFAPMISNNNQALDLIVSAIRKSGFVNGKDVSICLDIAANELCKKKEGAFLYAPNFSLGVNIFFEINRKLALLEPKRKHYQYYFSSYGANDNIMKCKQGLKNFLRSYFYFKSYDYKGNKPFKLKNFKAEELSKMPEYYIMKLNLGMAQTVKKYSPSAKELLRCIWLNDVDLKYYVKNYLNSGIKKPLSWYKVMLSKKEKLRIIKLKLPKSIYIPSIFISGSADWGMYQKPGDLEKMEKSFLKNYFGRFIIKQAGHWVQQEQPNKTFELIIKFFKKL